MMVASVIRKAPPGTSSTLPKGSSDRTGQQFGIV